MIRQRIFLTGLGVTLAGCLVVQAAEKTNSQPVAVQEKTMLFNGQNLAGWIGFLPEKDEIADNWSVVNGVLRCEGTPVGYLRTVDSYQNYKLHVEWRWPGEPSNSGVLLHRQGKDQSFPLCIEAQLKSSDAGDLVMMSGGALTVGGEKIVAEKFAAAKKKQPSNEKPPGEWNSYDIVCNEGAITLIVNGEEQNHGVQAEPASGQIALQSEGAPIEFRNIYLAPVESSD